MEKLKLNIQKFASTNQTTHLELSQYTANDKPTYLVDYNGDMLKIDTAVYANTTKATQNETNIGTMSNLDTTEKGSLVGAINEVNTQVGTNTSAITSLNTQTGANTGNIGTMANLETTDKTSLVNAINEVKGDFEVFNFTHFDSITDTDLTKTNISSSITNLVVASNEDGSIFKLYGQIIAQLSQIGTGTITFNSRIRPSSNITIAGAGIKFYEFSNGLQTQRMADFSVDTSGVVTISFANYGSTVTSESTRFLFMANLYFGKDFGDTPINN